jgi:hypothetical protein
MPDWTVSEFEILLGNPGLTNEELVKLLPRRSADAIQIVRNGIHSYHRGMNVSMLSQMMLKVLDEEAEGKICPVCGSQLG